VVLIFIEFFCPGLKGLGMKESKQKFMSGWLGEYYCPEIFVTNFVSMQRNIF
jgi:hypothetical protein